AAPHLHRPHHPRRVRGSPGHPQRLHHAGRTQPLLRGDGDRGEQGIAGGVSRVSTGLGTVLRLALGATSVVAMSACEHENPLAVPDAGARALPRPLFAEDAAMDLAPPPDMTWFCTDDRDCSGDTFCQAGRCVPWGKPPRGEHAPDGPPILTARDVDCFQ